MARDDSSGATHHNVESFNECNCKSPAADPVRYEFPDDTYVEMKGCLNCGGLVDWELQVDYSIDEITPDDLPDAGECRTHRCEDTADVVVQLRRDPGSITAYCEECWEHRKKNQKLRRTDRGVEVLARVKE